MRESDIFSFYFDEKTGKWTRIGRFGAAQGGALVSLTEHFTDFVNATLAMPDDPGVKSYSPNDIKGIKLASPSAGLDLIAPPAANGSGSANVHDAIETPPGRNGVEPALAFSYSSEKQNGWLGVGWDLRVSSIEIDTRFGVPQYDFTNDRYLLDGEELTPSSTPNQYIRRVEGRFDKIVRNMESGCATSWTVTDKHGTVYTYGNTGSVLADPSNACHVFRWGLSSVQDTFGNRMTVTYATDSGSLACAPGAPAGCTERFVELYPDNIQYTSHTSGLAAAYEVLFARDNGQGRPDVVITGRPGFQERTRFRLDHVDVLLQPGTSSAQIIRRYQLAYLADTPADASHFHKSLLSSIALQGVPAGTSAPQSLTPTVQLDQHTFDYLAAQQGFAAQKKWGSVQIGPAPGSARTSDGLSRTDDSFNGVTGEASISFLGLIGVGVNGTLSGGDDNVGLSLMDLNGDGLPDMLDSAGIASLALSPRPNNASNLQVLVHRQHGQSGAHRPE